MEGMGKDKTGGTTYLVVQKEYQERRWRCSSSPLAFLPFYLHILITSISLSFSYLNSLCILCLLPSYSNLSVK
jgi:hypothetical protein